VTAPFDPRDFLALARRLAWHSTDQASLRSAVSRAYYSVFLLARGKVGVTTRERPHKAVIDALKKLDYSLGTKLAALRRLRTIADYDIMPRCVRDRDWVRNWARANGYAGDLMRWIDG
jgi:hypothetical protein